MKKQKLSVAARREENWGWIMVAPTIIGLLVLNIWPFIQTIYTSFCEHLGFGHYKLIGLQNYIDMFQSPEFWKATGNTIVFCVLTVPVGVILALFVAMLLNSKVKFKGGFGDLMWPQVVNSDINMMTLSAGLSTLQGQFSDKFPVLMAGSLLAMLPMIVLYLIFQRQFVEGIAGTGGK